METDSQEYTLDEARLGENRRGPASKSQKKREMDALQDLGAQLVALSSERLKKIDLPEELRAAVREAQRISSHGAHRRQLQYIGKVMRQVDPAPIQAALDEINGVSAAATARMHRLEHLREKLLADEAVLGEIARNFPAADLQRLRQLRRNALKELATQKPPKAFREIFRLLRDLENDPENNAVSIADGEGADGE